MNEVERALSQIAEIHAQMSASSRFRGFAPTVLAFNAVLCIAVTLAQLLWSDLLAKDPVRYVGVWGAALGLATLLSAAEAVSRSRRLHGRMADAMLGSTLRMLLPFAAAGVVLAVAVSRIAPASAWIIPGLWQVLVGLAGFAAAPSLPRAIPWAAGWFFICGAVVFGLGARTGELSPWMMGVPFTAGLAGVAFILHRETGGPDVCK